MRVVHLAAEFSPIAKVGGLGDMVTGLCRTLASLGHEVHAILPRYDSAKLPSQIKLEIPDFKVLSHANAMWEVDYAGCHLHLLEARHPAGYFHRGRVYGCEDDIPRFLYFSRAALEYLKLKNEPIDVLHLHDWHVAVCAAIARELFQLPIKTILLTLHNVEYQGKCAPADLEIIGLNPNKFQDEMQPHLSNILKGGILSADAVTTVSPTYAQEILTPAFGFHLDPTLRKCKSKLTGILNGLDETLWNPSLDPHLPMSYTTTSIQDAKQKAKAALQQRFGLNPNRRPWIGSICRLVRQKGPDLLDMGLRACLQEGGTFILLGSAPSPEVRAQFEALRQDNALIHFDLDEPLAHLAYAALDLLLMPSLFEPCGLAQMIAMRYGTPPIATAVGGLKDTVFDCEDATIPVSQRNGFLIASPTSRDLLATLHRAIHLFRSNPATFQSLQKRGMQTDFSWKQPVREYLKLYEKFAARSRAAFVI